MTTIFIVTSGSYSNYGINAVFTEKKYAEEYVKIFNILNSYDELRIEEYEANPHQEEIKKGRYPFWVQMSKDGEKLSVKISDIHGKDKRISYTYDKSHINIYCYAEDKLHAIKIANEKRIELIAMDLWGKE